DFLFANGFATLASKIDEERRCTAEGTVFRRYDSDWFAGISFDGVIVGARVRRALLTDGDFGELSGQTALVTAAVREELTGSDVGLAAIRLGARPKRGRKPCDIVAPLGRLSALV